MTPSPKKEHVSPPRANNALKQGAAGKGGDQMSNGAVSKEKDRGSPPKDPKEGAPKEAPKDALQAEDDPPRPKDSSPAPGVESTIPTVKT